MKSIIRVMIFFNFIKTVYHAESGKNTFAHNLYRALINQEKIIRQ